MQITSLPATSSLSASDVLVVEIGGVTYKILASTLASALQTIGSPLAAAKGGTGLTASPSMLTNLSSDSAANILQATPRPGVTGVLPLVHGGFGIDMSAAANAGFHNSFYRGKYLGTSVTAAQYTAISNGTFADMFIGDYWTINGVNWRIAAFDYWLNCGDTNTTTHHVVIVPDTALVSSKMNNSHITTGGYVGSDFYTGSNSISGKSDAITAVNNAFGAAHILSHRELFTNAVTDGKASGWAWYDSTVDLMNEVMVYGTNAWSSAPGYETGIDKSQLPLFALEPSRICNRGYWWLRSVSSATYFAVVGDGGDAYGSGGAGNSLGIRPAFAIKA